MAPDELDAIEARANAATPAPWFNESHGGELEPLVTGAELDGGDDSGERHAAVLNYGVLAASEVNANWTFVGHARTDIPDLIREIRRLRKIVYGKRNRRGVRE